MKPNKGKHKKASVIQDNLDVSGGLPPRYLREIPLSICCQVCWTSINNLSWREKLGNVIEANDWAVQVYFFQCMHSRLVTFWPPLFGLQSHLLSSTVWCFFDLPPKFFFLSKKNTSGYFVCFLGISVWGGLQLFSTFLRDVDLFL